MSESGYSSVFCGQVSFEAAKSIGGHKSAKKTCKKIDKENPVYTSTKNVLKENEEISNSEEGLRRLTGKYDSPGNVMSQLTSGGFSTGIPLYSSDTIQHATVKTTQSDIPSNNMIFNGSPMLDGSPDMSWPGSSSPGNIFAEGVQEHDLLQVEMFYRSHKTEVTVGQCLANLYFGSEKTTDNVEKWNFVNTGIPLLVLDTGEHHRNRKLTIVLAEKGTGFALWKDSIDHLTKYSSPNSNFHTMYISTDHNKLAGLSFDDTNAASEFFTFIQSLTENPADELLALSKKKKKNREKKEKKPKFKPPRRSDISQPCCFVHITKLEPPEMLVSSQSESVNELSNMVSEKLEIPRSESSEISEDSISHSEKL